MNTNEQANRRQEEFKQVFAGLDDSAREVAISILRALEYAQRSVFSAAADISKLNMEAVAV